MFHVKHGLYPDPILLPMRCPHCAHTDTRVIDSRPAEGGSALRRRRLCDACGHRFSTHERLLQAPLFIVKKDGRREEFNVAKLRGGLINACNKLPVATDEIDRIVAEIEISLRQEPGSEVCSSVIGEMVMDKLFALDQVAYVRFASVYQRFDDVKRFAQLLDRISRHTRRRKSDSAEASPDTTAFTPVATAEDDTIVP